jgi:hypothetical protein
MIPPLIEYPTLVSPYKKNVQIVMKQEVHQALMERKSYKALVMPDVLSRCLRCFMKILEMICPYL